MPFANPVMLIGLSAGLIPLILHLLNRRRADRVDWGAMIFLIGSVVGRNRRILLEEALLLALRCMMLALVAMAMALPFVPPSSRLPWLIMLPMLLVGLIALGAGTALWAYRKWRWGLYALGVVLIGGAVAASVAERAFQMGKWGRGEQDIVIIIDGSASMNISVDGKTNFQRAIEEAGTIIGQVGSNYSIGVVVAGSVPQVVTPLSTDTDRLLNDLGNMKLPGGSLAVDAALRAAADVLGTGQNSLQKIIIVSDGQAVGWKQGDRINWARFATAFEQLREQPRIVIDVISMPTQFQNAQIADFSLSRETIGTDRPVTIRTRVENAGSGPIKNPLDLVVRVDGEPVARQTVRPMELGKSETFACSFHFHKPGPHYLEAKIEQPDDQPLDNTAARVINVVGSVPVLLVEGNTSTSPEDLTSEYMRFALTDPTLVQLDPKNPAASEQLFQITTVKAVDLAQVKAFDSYAVIALCDVSTLQSQTTLRLTQFVAAGGGLIIFPGDKCDPTFYNRKNWSILPAELGKWVVTGRGQVVKPQMDSFQNRAQGLRAMASDISVTIINEFWRLDVDPSDSVSMWARLDNGDPGSPLIIERQVPGGGRVIMAATSLGSRFSNLQARKICSPLIYEMVSSLVPPGRLVPELDPRCRATLPLPKKELTNEKLTATGAGLRADYFIGDFYKHFMTVLDPIPSITQKVPKDQSSVQWSGTITAPKDGTYKFELVADDHAELFIDGRSVVVSNKTAQTGTYDMKAGEFHDFRLVLKDDAPPASIQLFWSIPGVMDRIAIPNTAFDPARSWERAKNANFEGTLELPTGEQRTVMIRSDENKGFVADIGDIPQPGLYLLELPLVLQGMDPDSTIAGRLPFDVRIKPDEGRLTSITDADVAKASDDHMTVAMTSSAGETIDVAIKGESGRKLWRILALMALVTTVLEIALARWIAVQRKIGVVQPIDLQAELREMHEFRMKAQAVMHSRPF